MKTIDYSYFIERYNAGEMNQAEKTWFDKELQADESLQKEVLLRKKTDKILERGDIISLRNKLSFIEDARTRKASKPGKLQTPRFRYAAVITGLVIIGSLLFQTFDKPNYGDIYSKNFKPGSYSSVSRSAGGTYDEAYDYYSKGEFDKALIGFQSYLKTNPGSTKTEFMSGLSNMGLKNFPDAELSFNKVINNKATLYSEEANWYLAGCFIATEDIVMAKVQLRKIVESESNFKSKAKAILRHL